MKITDEAVEAVAKAIANSIGHGMREKCYDHARAALEAALPYLSQGVVRVVDDVAILQSIAARPDLMNLLDTETATAINEALSSHELTTQEGKELGYDARGNLTTFDVRDEGTPAGIQEGMSATGGKLHVKLQEWRDEDHESSLRLHRDQVIEICEEYRSIQSSLTACQQEVERLRGENAKLFQKFEGEEEAYLDGFSDGFDAAKKTRNKRADTAEARILELETDLEITNDLIRKKNKALRNIRELNMSAPDEKGLRWVRSDLIEQEIVFGLRRAEQWLR